MLTKADIQFLRELSSRVEASDAERLLEIVSRCETIRQTASKVRAISPELIERIRRDRANGASLGILQLRYRLSRPTIIKYCE
jgi:hypothetical protein